MSGLRADVWPPSQPLLIGIFALHNLEEILSIRYTAFNQDVLDAFGLDASWYRQDRMALATGLLTALSHGLSRKLDNPANTRQAFLGATVAGAVAGNALSHLGRALVQRRYNGGLVTSLVLLPTAVQPRWGSNAPLGTEPRARTSPGKNAGARTAAP